MNAVSEWIAGLGIWPLIVLLVPSFAFRRLGRAAVKKRMASLMQAVAVFAISVAALLIMEFGGDDGYLLMALGLIAGISVLLRKKMFPYRFTCPACGKRLDMKTLYMMDDNLCADCRERSD